MARYTVISNPGADRERQTNHATWQAAFTAGRKAKQAGAAVIEIVERDQDGQRTYNLDGDVIAITRHPSYSPSDPF